MRTTNKYYTEPNHFEEKTDKWWENCADYYSKQFRELPQIKEYKKHLDYFENNIKEYHDEDYKFIFKSFKTITESAIFTLDVNKIKDLLKPYNILYSNIQWLVGRKDELKTDKQIVHVVNDDVFTIKLQQELELKKQKLQAEFLQQILPSIQDIDEEQIQGIKQEIEEKLKVFDESYRDQRAIYGQHILNAIDNKYEISNKQFVQGFKDYLLNLCVFHKKYNGVNFNYERLNPLNVYFPYHENLEHIEDAEYIVVKKQRTLSELLEEHNLTKKDIDKLTAIIDYKANVGYISEQKTDVDILNKNTSLITTHRQSTNIRYYTEYVIYFKSKRKVKLGLFLNSFNELEKEEILESSDLNKYESTIEEWINDVCKVVKIGELDSVYLYKESLPDELQRLEENINTVKLPINGIINNISIAKLLLPFQIMINELVFKKTKSLLQFNDILRKIDLNRIPKKIKPNEYLALQEALGIDVGKTDMDNYDPQYQAVIDLTNRNIGVFDELINSLVFAAESIIGIPRQAKGVTQQYETGQANEQAVIMSGYILSPLFNNYGDFESKELLTLINWGKVLYKTSKFLQYQVEDKIQYFHFDSNVFSEGIYGINVISNLKHEKKLALLKNPTLLQQILAKDQTNITLILDLLTTDNYSELKKLVKVQDEKFELLQQQQQELQNKLQEEQLALQKQANKERIAFEREKMNVPIKVQELRNIVESRKIDYDNDGTNDFVQAFNNDEIEKAKLQENKRQFEEKMILENKKLNKKG